MKQEHITENELQQLALKQQEASHQQAAHIAACAQCSAAIANYQAMFAALSTMEKPLLNFDIEKLVMAELSISGKRKSLLSPAALGISLLPVAIVAIPVYLFRHYLTHLFTTIYSPVLYLAAAVAATIVLFQCRELLIAYRKKLQQLSYY